MRIPWIEPTRKIHKLVKWNVLNCVVLILFIGYIHCTKHSMSISAFFSYFLSLLCLLRPLQFLFSLAFSLHFEDASFCLLFSSLICIPNRNCINGAHISLRMRIYHVKCGCSKKKIYDVCFRNGVSVQFLRFFCSSAICLRLHSSSVCAYTHGVYGAII